MHLIIGVRGIKKELDDFITQLQGKYFPFKYVPEGKTQPEDFMVQMNVQPIQFFSLVFPETSRDIVLNTILQGKTEQEEMHSYYNKILWMIRKALKLEKIKPYKTDLKFPINIDSIEIIGIGEKKDYFNKHEGL